MKLLSGFVTAARPQADWAGQTWSGSILQIFPICMMQIRFEQNANVCSFHILAPPQKQMRWLKVRRGGQSGDYIFTLHCDSQGFFWTAAFLLEPITLTSFHLQSNS